MRKKGISEVMVRAVMSLYDSTKTRVRVGSAYSEEFEVKVNVHQGSLLSLKLFSIVVDIIAEIAKKLQKFVVDELLYADGLALMSETTEDLKQCFLTFLALVPLKFCENVFVPPDLSNKHLQNYR